MVEEKNCLHLVSTWNKMEFCGKLSQIYAERYGQLGEMTTDLTIFVENCATHRDTKINKIPTYHININSYFGTT